MFSFNHPVSIRGVRFEAEGYVETRDGENEVYVERVYVHNIWVDVKPFLNEETIATIEVSVEENVEALWGDQYFERKLDEKIEGVT